MGVGGQQPSAREAAEVRAFEKHRNTRPCFVKRVFVSLHAGGKRWGHERVARIPRRGRGLWWAGAVSMKKMKNENGA